MIGPLELGIWGLIVAQIVSQCIYNAWYWSKKAHAELDLSITNMIKYGNTEMFKLFRGFIYNRVNK